MASEIQNIRIAAMNLLAIREHSETELRGKLLRKFTDLSLINTVIDQLIEQQLLSDMRFAESFIRMRFRQLKGPLLITLELKSKGIDPVLIEACMDELDLGWDLAVQRSRAKKFGHIQPSDLKDKAKQVRYLQSRGYDNAHIRMAFGVSE